MAKSTTQYLEFEGKVAWAQVYEPDNAFGATNWKLNLFPKDDNEWARIKAAGIQKRQQENNDPSKGPTGKFIQFTRPANKVIKGNMVCFTGPIITNHDDAVIVDYIDAETEKRIFSYDPNDKNKVVRRGKPIAIGNGSDVKIRVAVYDTLKGKGQRLEAVKVLNLVEYVREERELPPVLEDVRTALAPVDMPATTSSSNDIPF